MKITLIKWWSDLLLKPSVDPLTPLFNCSMKENSELWVEFAISLGILKFVLSLVNFIHRPHFILGIWVTPTQYNTHSKSEQLLNAKSQTVISMNDKILDCYYLVYNQILLMVWIATWALKTKVYIYTIEIMIQKGMLTTKIYLHISLPNIKQILY